MAEPVDEPEIEVEDGIGPISPAGAMAIGLRKGRGGARPDPKLDAFLDEQTRLVRLQTEHLHEQRALQLAHLRVRRWKDRLSLALQTLGVLVGAAVVAGIGVMAWQAHEDHGLVIDAFSAPPDLARDGLTSQVAAGRFLDRLQALQAATAESDRPSQSFQNNWDSEIKVEIPETGLTFGEFEKLLREKLGHVSHVGGEVLRTPGGIALTARIGDAPPETFTGAAADFDSLAQKAAEAVFRQSQPYRYVEYLDAQFRWPEAFAVIADLAAHGPDSERGWAYAKWALMDVNDHGDVASSRLHYAKGLGVTPESDLADRISLISAAVWSGDEETNLQQARRLFAEAFKRLPDTSRVFYEETKLLSQAWLQFSLSDYRTSALTWSEGSRQRSKYLDLGLAEAMAATAYALDHDPAAARRAAAAAMADRDETSLMWQVAYGAFTALPTYWLAAEAGNWPTALADARRVDAWLEANKTQRPVYGLLQKVWIQPLEAIAEARSGDLAGATTLIGRAPLDCYLCLRARGLIAAEARDWPGAEAWFAEAVRQAPSAPLAYAERGRVRLARGDVQGAIADLALAHQKSPRFADPLELLGEALMRQGDFAGAAGKFTEADKDAPAWGRNHLEWGEALMLSGRYAEARRRFEVARTLDLSGPDRAALGVLLARTARGPLHG
ncbi:MAG TPA: hypothetical protein VIJ94_02055 [Caulobacteraceae bacterium]